MNFILHIFKEEYVCNKTANCTNVKSESVPSYRYIYMYTYICHIYEKKNICMHVKDVEINKNCQHTSKDISDL